MDLGTQPNGAPQRHAANGAPHRRADTVAPQRPDDIVAPQRRAVLVVGMHRSGTSALTRVLNLLGVELGEDLLPPRPGVNDRGFFEHSRVHELHQDLLDSLGAAWDDVLPLPDGWWRDGRVRPHRDRLERILREEFAHAPLFGVKDPRLCLLYPLWSELLRELGVEPCPVLILRPPDEVAASLARTRGFGPEKAHALWLRHVAAAERATRDGPRAIVTFEQLLASWSDVAGRIAAAFGLSWPRSTQAAAGAIGEFLDPELRRCRSGEAGGHGANGDDRLHGAALHSRRAWNVLAAAIAGAPVDLFAAFDAIVPAFETLLSSGTPLVAGELRAVRGHLSEARTSLRETKARARRIQTVGSATKALAAARGRLIDDLRADLARLRSELDASGERLERLDRERATLQSELAAARAALERRRSLLRRARATPVWKLLSALRALRRHGRRIRRGRNGTTP